MTPRQWKVTAVIASALVVILVAVVVVVAATGGDDEGAISTDGSTTSSSSTTTQPAATTTTLPPVLPPGTSPPATITPGSTLVVPTAPPPTAAPTTTTKKPPATTTTKPSGGSDVGITPTDIHLAVIADDAVAFDGMTAWMNQANKSEIAGRKVRLDLLPTNGSADGYAQAVQTACDKDFAIVGSFSAFDTATESAGCAAIPDLPLEAVSPPHQIAANAYAAFPRRPATVTAGQFTFISGSTPGCCSQYWLVPNAGAARDRALAEADGAAKVGFDTAGTADVAPSDPASRYDEIVQDIIDTNATFGASGLSPQQTILLRNAATIAGTPNVKAWYCSSQCYDSALLGGGNDVEDQLIAIETTPFGDRMVVASLRTYIKATNKAGNDPTYTGLRAFVAGLLFEQAAKQVVDAHGPDGITRVRLLDVLAGIHDFSGGGIVGPTDVGARQPNGCYVLLKVKNGHFTRLNPADKGQLDCGPQNLAEIGD